MKICDILNNNESENLLKEWLEFREEDKKHFIYFEEISKRILNSIPNKNRKYVQKQLEILDRNIFDYSFYWNEKYYRNGFCDGVQMVSGCFDE